MRRLALLLALLMFSTGCWNDEPTYPTLPSGNFTTALDGYYVLENDYTVFVVLYSQGTEQSAYVFDYMAPAHFNYVCCHTAIRSSGDMVLTWTFDSGNVFKYSLRSDAPEKIQLKITSNLDPKTYPDLIERNVKLKRVSRTNFFLAFANMYQSTDFVKSPGSKIIMDEYSQNVLGMNIDLLYKGQNPQTPERIAFEKDFRDFTPKNYDFIDTTDYYNKIYTLLNSKGDYKDSPETSKIVQAYAEDYKAIYGPIFLGVLKEILFGSYKYLTQYKKLRYSGAALEEAKEYYLSQKSVFPIGLPPKDLFKDMLFIDATEDKTTQTIHAVEPRSVAPYTSVLPATIVMPPISMNVTIPVKGVSTIEKVSPVIKLRGLDSISQKFFDKVFNAHHFMVIGPLAIHLAPSQLTSYIVHGLRYYIDSLNHPWAYSLHYNEVKLPSLDDVYTSKMRKTFSEDYAKAIKTEDYKDEIRFKVKEAKKIGFPQTTEELTNFLQDSFRDQTERNYILIPFYYNEIEFRAMVEMLNYYQQKFKTTVKDADLRALVFGPGAKAFVLQLVNNRNTGGETVNAFFPRPRYESTLLEDLKKKEFSFPSLFSYPETTSKLTPQQEKELKEFM